MLQTQSNKKQALGVFNMFSRHFSDFLSEKITQFKKEFDQKKLLK